MCPPCQMPVHTALLLVANGSEDIETVTIIDILRRGEINLNVVSVEGEIKLANDTKIVPDEDLKNLTISQRNSYDILILPGGSKGTQTFINNEEVQSLIKSYHQNQKFVAAICAAPLALTSILVKGKSKLTSYPSLEAHFQDYHYDRLAAVVNDNKIITSRGPATAIPFALEIVAQLKGRTDADKIAKDICFV